MRGIALLSVLMFGLLGTSSRGADEHWLQLPPGFKGQKFSTDQQAANIQALTFNTRGEVVVSGPGYINILKDTNQDGVADQVQTFADGPATGAQGLFVDGSSYYCVGDGGILEYTDVDGDGRADGPPELKFSVRTGGEHFAHALRKGPDGDWYLIAGNESQINASTVTAPTSPIKTPTAGVLMRLSDQFRHVEILADGYRNAYDFDFTAEGDLCTYDSDGEREISLPIYQPTRVFHTITGMNHGWVTRSWKKPNYFPDMSPVLVELGRGSPTGVVVYRHHQFPEEFQNAVFVLDWTYGRVVAVKGVRQGSSWTAQAKLFASGKGDFGFAPTDVEIGPDGAMYVAVGGRGTQGSIFRITYQPEVTTDRVDSEKGRVEQIDSILDAPQPLSAWSRAKWEPQARKLGEEKFLLAVLDTNRSTAERSRALEILTDLFYGPDIDLLRSLTIAEDRELRARAIWAYGRSVGTQPDNYIIKRYLADQSPVVVRTTLELLNHCDEQCLSGLETELAATLGHSDRVVRQLAVQVINRMNNESFRIIGELARKAGWLEAMQMARAFVARGYVGHPYAWHDIGLESLKRHTDAEMRLEAILLIQESLGGLGDSPVHEAVFDGYLAKRPLPAETDKLNQLGQYLTELFPTGAELVDLELTRLAAMIQTENPLLMQKLLDRITATSDPIADIHHFICLSCLNGPRATEITSTSARQLLVMQQKIVQHNLVIDRNWEPRIAEMFSRLVIQDPQLPLAMVADSEFGKAEQTLFVNVMTGAARQQALLKFVQQIQDRQLQLTPGVLGLFSGMKNEQVLRIARGCLQDETLQPIALTLLAEANSPDDYEIILSGLDSAQWDVVGSCLSSISQWTISDPQVLMHLWKLSRRLAEEEEYGQLWNQTIRQLEKSAAELAKLFDTIPATGPELSEIPSPYRSQLVLAWQDWIKQNFPDQLANFQPATPNDQNWDRLFAEIDFSQGEAAAGKELFIRQQCAQCHQGRSAVGPSLEGVTRRFSPRDLFTAIVDPHRDVSPRYRATMMVTEAGKTYTGIVIYESSDGLLLRDSTHQTVRIEANQIEFRKQLKTSFMPENLLKQLTPAQIASLFAYLKEMDTNTQLTTN